MQKIINGGVMENEDTDTPSIKASSSGVYKETNTNADKNEGVDRPGLLYGYVKEALDGSD